MRTELLDLETIRRELYYTLQEMAEQLMLMCRSSRLTKIQVTRVHEWERGVRPVPHHIIAAYAGVAMACWRARRERTAAPEVMEVDLRYSRLINPSVARLLFARERLRTAGHDAVALEAVEDALRQLFKHYRRIFDVDLSFCLVPPPLGNPRTKTGKPSRRSPKGIPLRWMS
ncbi:hypothetical protein [Geobacter anodireducens]|uniref:Uncharacterized protein n=1 Tax=Geobacter soli TaxID=1510391 RepID=A0A0C1U8N7_9BACT|nr:hypothetical protein [Geobacter soli]KIE43940.1 hypothetical protein SE37_15570 [Geobacter soli]